MKCEIRSWGEKEVDCNSKITGNCAQCDAAWNYMSLFGPESFSSKLSSIENARVGQDLVTTVRFNDGDPKKYKCIISSGRYIHLQES